MMIVPVANAGTSLITSVENSADQKHKIVHASYVIERTSTCVWKSLNTPEQFPQFIPRLSKAKHLDTQDGKEKFFVIIDPPFPFKEIINVLSVTFIPEKNEIFWEMLEGNIAKNDGHVTLIDMGTSAKLSVKMLLDLGGSWPKSLTAWGVKYYLPKVLRSIEKRVLDSSCAGS